MALFASILSTPVSASVPIGRRLINGRSHSRLFASLSPSESSPSTPATTSSNNETAVSSRTPPSKPFAESSRQHDPSFKYARANPAGDSPLGFFRPIESNIERDLGRRCVEILNEAELGSSHVGVSAGVYLLTKDAAHTRDELSDTRDKPGISSWQNSYTEIPMTVHE